LSSKILGEKEESLIVDCANGWGIYEATIKADNRFSKWVTSKLKHGTIEFDASEVYKVSSICLSPHLWVLRDNVIRDGNKLILDLKPLLKCDLFRIEVVHRMKDDDFFKGLVRSRASPEPLRENLKYELSAQLRNPAGLAMGFSEIEIEEFPVTARVHIRNHLDTGVPKYFKELFKIEHEILDEKNPHGHLKIINLQRERARLLKRLGRNTNILEKIQQLAVFLAPTNFLNYIDPLELADFRLHNCEEDEFFTALGMLALPKTMAVISRTDLTLKRPAAKGTLIYKSGEFEQAVAKLFGK